LAAPSVGMAWANAAARARALSTDRPESEQSPLATQLAAEFARLRSLVKHGRKLEARQDLQSLVSRLFKTPADAGVPRECFREAAELAREVEQFLLLQEILQATIERYGRDPVLSVEIVETQMLQRRRDLAVQSLSMLAPTLGQDTPTLFSLHRLYRAFAAGDLERRETWFRRARELQDKLLAREPDAVPLWLDAAADAIKTKDASRWTKVAAGARRALEAVATQDFTLWLKFYWILNGAADRGLGGPRKREETENQMAEIAVKLHSLEPTESGVMMIVARHAAGLGGKLPPASIDDVFARLLARKEPDPSFWRRIAVYAEKAKRIGVARVAAEKCLAIDDLDQTAAAMLKGLNRPA